MARPLSEKIGRGPCPSGCGATVTFRQSSGGKLTHTCDACDSSGYAERGGDAFKQRMGTMQALEREAIPKETEKSNPKEETPPPPKPKNSVFSLADL